MKIVEHAVSSFSHDSTLAFGATKGLPILLMLKSRVRRTTTIQLRSLPPPCTHGEPPPRPFGASGLGPADGHPG